MRACTKHRNGIERTRASFILDPSCKRDPKDFLQMGSEPRADTDRFNLFIDNNATSLRLLIEQLYGRVLYGDAEVAVCICLSLCMTKYIVIRFYVFIH